MARLMFPEIHAVVIKKRFYLEALMEKEIYSLCFMCSIRCPIKVKVKDGQVKFIEGNPHVAGVDGRLCPKGAAGTSLLYDKQRVQSPMIRDGARGSGKWRAATWDEAYDYIGEKLNKIIAEHGGHSVLLGERGQLATHVSKTFLKAIGSPNHFSHDTLCKGSVSTACRSMFGISDGQIGIDYKNTKHIVLYGRNLFESINIKEVNAMMSALENGAKITYIDPRVSVTATKAQRYWKIRPGTDLALNYALMNVIISERLYDAAFVEKWVVGMDELRAFTEKFTPEWAEKETGIPAAEIATLAREMSADAPNVVFHYGYRGAHHLNETYLRRSMLILNVLMGSVECPGGMVFKKNAKEAGGAPLRKLTGQEFPKIDVPRFDKVGTIDFPLPDANHGAPQVMPYAIENEDPYPIKALFAFRFEPLMSIADRAGTLAAFEKLDLIVAIDVNYSDTAWNADVILPESTYLERMDCPQQANGLKPQVFLRKPAVAPLHDTREGAMILKQIGERIGIGEYFPYENMEELVRWQLEGTGFTLEDFEKKGFVAYGGSQIFWDRMEGLKLKTPSGKIEIKSSLLENAGFESLPEYEPVAGPEEGKFRLVVGRSAVHTHVSTQNVPYLNEIVSENKLWINTVKAAELGIKDGEMVTIASKIADGKIKAFVTDHIHPEAVFMLHGFGHRSRGAKRSYNKGVSDADLQENIYDKVGGSPAYHDTFVTVTPAG